VCILAAGCNAPAVYHPWTEWEGLETRKQADGSIFVLDTASNWKFFSSTIGAEVKREAKGSEPPGNIGFWTDFWHRSFAEIRTSQEHPEKYFALILDLRRRSDLPDLPREAIELE
jgi:hypothetical protein